MRKVLLATTALFGLALSTGGALAAPPSDGLQVTLGGSTEFRAGFYDEDLDVGTLDRAHVDFETVWLLAVDAKGKANMYNGVEYGAHVDLTNAPRTVLRSGTRTMMGDAVRIDQAYVHVGSKWGKLVGGDHRGASDLFVYAPTVGTGQIAGNGSYYNYLNSSTVFAVSPTFVDENETSTRLTYFTPKLGNDQHKVQLGVSYAPKYDNRGSNIVLFRELAGPYENLWKFAGKYEGKWNKINAALSFKVDTASRNNRSTTARDFTLWGIGGQVNYAGFTVGASYVDAGRYGTATGQNKNQKAWTVGGKYEMGPAAVAVNYLRGEGYGTASSGLTAHRNYSRDYQAIGFGATYSFLPGFVTGVDAVFFDQEHFVSAADNEGHVVILSQKVNF